jgi:hypothetical protein
MNQPTSETNLPIRLGGAWTGRSAPKSLFDFTPIAQSSPLAHFVRAAVSSCSLLLHHKLRPTAFALNLQHRVHPLSAIAQSY